MTEAKIETKDKKEGGGLKRLEELKEELYRCIHCRACRFSYSGEPDRQGLGEYKGVLYEGMLDGCPAGHFFGWEGFWNAGRMWMARSVLEGDLDLSDEKIRQQMYDILYRCPTCGNCSMQCENNLPTVDINEALRACLVDAGVELLPKHEGLRKLIDAKNNPYNEEHAHRTDWVPDKSVINDPDAKIAYYVGCTASYRMKDMALATFELLSKLVKRGIIPKFTILTDEVCCGSVVFRTGQWVTAKKVANINVDLYNRFDIVLFSCAGCVRTFKLDYPKFTGKDIKFKPMHVIEFLADYLTVHCPACGKYNDVDSEYCQNPFCPKYSDPKISKVGGGEPFPPELRENKIRITKEYNHTVTWHDPCHIIRHYCHSLKDEAIEKTTGEGDNNMWKTYVPSQFERERWIEMPRAIMHQIPGLKLNEMYRIGENSLCCGAGGGVKAGYPDFAWNAANERLEEAEATGAEILMTACPFCELNMGQAAREGIDGSPEGASCGGKFKGKVIDLLELLNELID
ncbi:MAG: (Fe-S)-binding protein [Candidatus Helarchaeota archaeon]